MIYQKLFEAKGIGRLLLEKYFVNGEFNYFVYLNNGNILLYKSLNSDVYNKYLMKTDAIYDTKIYFQIGLLMLGLEEIEALSVNINNVSAYAVDIIAFTAFQIVNFEFRIIGQTDDEVKDFVSFVNGNTYLDNLYIFNKNKINIKNTAQIIFVNSRQTKEILVKRKEDLELALNIARASNVKDGAKDIINEIQSTIDEIKNGINSTVKGMEAVDKEFTKEITGKDINTREGLLQELEQMKTGRKDLHDELVQAYKLNNLKNKEYKAKMDAKNLNPALKKRLDKILNKVLKPEEDK